MTVAHSADAVTTWSTEQELIFDWFRTGTGHLVVEALAGTGKTTTIVKAVGYAPEQRILVAAFNKRIADEVSARLSQVNPRATAKTLHSVGYACIMKFWPGLRPNAEKPGTLNRADHLTEAVCGGTAPDVIKKLVSKLHTKGREIAPHARTIGDLTDIMVTFECEPDESWDDTNFNSEYVEARALEAMDLAAKVKPVQTGIDFADMIFLPVRNAWMTKQYDLGVVDETQDMTVAQLELMRGVCKGRICIVGDPNQAIYAFRGADSNGMSRLRTELNAATLTLTTTYRCGRAIVARAAELVPTFRAGENNPDGEILDITEDKLVATLAHGDFLLSRVNAPLVSYAMSLLRNGKRARIAGRDIGAGLKALIRRLAKGPAAHSIPAFLTKLTAWTVREVARQSARKVNGEIIPSAQAKIDGIHDQAEMIASLADGATSVNDIAGRIDALFTDDGLGQAGVITCSSVHRSKGLEANRVFVLRNTLKFHNQEELNIQYVAITRAKQTLVWVN